MIAANCYIDCGHGTHKGIIMIKQKTIVNPVCFGEDAWIGTEVAILKGSQINDGAVVEANVRVRSIIGSNVIAVGIPAKIVKYREDGPN